MYWLLVKSISKKLSCIKAWHSKYQIKFSDKTWEYIFNLPFTLTQDTKLLELQSKIVHRTYATDSFVSHFDNNVCINCQYCNVKNNIIHWFVSCTKVDAFWKLFTRWFNVNMDTDYISDVNTILFGNCEPNSTCINLCVLIAKMFIRKVYIQCQGTSSHYFSLPVYLNVLKSALCVQRYIATRNNKLQSYEDLYLSLESVL